MSREPVDHRLDHLLSALGRARPRLDDLTRARVAAGLAEAIAAPAAPAAAPPRRRVPHIRRIAAITAAALVVVAVGAGFASRRGILRGIPRVLGEPPADSHEVAAARRPPVEVPRPASDGERVHPGGSAQLSTHSDLPRLGKEELELAVLDAVRRDALTGPGAAQPGADRGGGPGARAATASPEAAAPPAGPSPEAPAQAAAAEGALRTAAAAVTTPTVTPTTAPRVASGEEPPPAISQVDTARAASPRRVATSAGSPVPASQATTAGAASPARIASSAEQPAPASQTGTAGDAPPARVASRAEQPAPGSQTAATGAAEPPSAHGGPSVAAGASLRPLDDGSSRPDAAARARVVDEPGVRSEGIITELRPLRASESVVADDIAAIRLGQGSIAARYAAAESLLRRDPPLARAMLRSLIADAPQAPETALALLDLANLAVKSGGTDDMYVARKALDRIAVHPFGASVAMPAAFLRCAIERNEAMSRACLTQFRARFPSSPYDVEALVYIAFSLVRAGDCAAARPLIAEYQRRYPNGDATAMVQTWHDRCSP